MSWISAIAQAASDTTKTIGNVWQTNKANKASKNAQARQIGWENYWSNTAVQRRMEDLQASGINPILAGDLTATTPAAGTYSAQAADMSNIGNPYEAYLQAEQTKANTASAKAQKTATEALKTKTENESEQIKELTPILKEKAQSEAHQAQASAAQADQNTKKMYLENKWIEENPKLYTIQQVAGAFGQALGGIGSLISSGANVGTTILRHKDSKQPHFNYNYNMNGWK